MAAQGLEELTIGTRKTFQNNYAFPYKKQQIGSETVYVCNKGSQWARLGEVLVLRCHGETWTAFDGAVSADGTTLQLRQPVFCCLADDIAQPGAHNWETNYAADPSGTGLSVD